MTTMMMMVTTVMMIMMTTTVQGVALKTEERGARTKRSDESGEEGEWSLWFNSDRPWDGEGDFETTDNIKKTYEICPSDYSVISAECRVAGTNDSFDSSTTAFLDDRLLQACSRHGLICLNAQQGSSRAGCSDYEVRFLCQATQSEHNSLFPNLDFRIYILLAAVPLVIILMRIMWTCCCKARVKRRQQQQRQGQRNSDTSSSGSLSTSSSQASFDSTLANPPPPYTELFGDNQPVFAISGGSGRGECAVCGKCLHSPYFVSVPSLLPSPPPTFPAQNVGGPEVVSSSGGNDDVFLPSNCTSHSTSQTAAASSTSQTGVSNSAEPVLRASLPSSSSLQGAVALPVVSSTAFANPNSNDVHGCCACACHHMHTAHVNLAFRWDSNDPAASVSGGPAALPGMHKPVFNFPRIDSTTSFTSYASLPDYEEAVEILKKSGLVLEDEKL